MAKRILIYGMNYAPEIAGVGRYTGEIGAHLAAAGHNVTAVTTPPHYPHWRPLKPYRNGRYTTERRDGVLVLRCPLFLRRKMRGIWRLIAPLSFALTSAPVVLWQIMRYRPDVILCIEPTLLCAPAVALAAGMTGSRTVLHVQDLEIDAAFAVGHLGSRPWLTRLAQAFERLALSAFDEVVTISRRMAERLEVKGVARDRLSVVRNWVDLSYIRPLSGKNGFRTELGLQEDTFIVQYSGTIGPKQGLSVLLTAAAKLESDPRVCFLIAGEGAAKPDLIARYGYLKNVKFLPFQPYERLCEFLNLADLHVIPQQPNTNDLVLPSKVGGMLASGRPILATAEHGSELATFLKDTAIIVPPGSSEALAQAISQQVQKRAKFETAGQSILAAELSKPDGLFRFETALLGSKPGISVPPVQSVVQNRAT